MVVPAGRIGWSPRSWHARPLPSDARTGRWAMAETIVGTNGDDRIVPSHTVPGQPFPSIGGDTIRGRDGDDWLDGGAGDDDLYGGAGDDILFVDDAADAVHEDAGQGVDRVLARASYTLSGG